jgi:hypothetical protein
MQRSLFILDILFRTFVVNVPKLMFDAVPIGHTQTKHLEITNISNEELKVKNLIARLSSYVK